MKAVCFWSGWDERSKIFFTAWIESMITMILEIPCRWVAWLIPHPIAKNSALELIILIVWWSILMISLLWMCMCAIEEATLFLILASITISMFDGVFDNLMARLLSYWIWDLNCWSLLLLNKWKENQLEKQSIILMPGVNLGLRGSNEGKTSLNWLFMSTKWFLMRLH